MKLVPSALNQVVIRAAHLLFICLLIITCIQIPCRSQDGTGTFKVAGKVMKSDGTPLPGAVVEATAANDELTPSVRTTADGYGSYTLDLSPGGYYLHIHHDDLVNSAREQYVRINESGEASASLDILTAKGCRVTGKLVDISTGKSVGGAKVVTRSGAHAVTEEDGAWSMVLPLRNHTVTAIKEGFFAPIVHFSATGDTAAVNIETKPGGVLRGRVTDMDGKPVPGARVGCRMTYFRLQSTTTDSNGEYTLAYLDPDAQTEISPYAEKYERAGSKLAVFPAGEREVVMDFRLQKRKTRSISGHVRHRDGGSLDGVNVSFGVGYSGREFARCKVEKDGSYLLEEVDAQESIIIAQAPGCAPTMKYVEDDKDLVVDLELSSPGYSVEGTIEDEDGNPIEGLTVCAGAWSPEIDKARKPAPGLRSSYKWLNDTKTDKNGYFKLQNLPAEELYVDAYGQGYPGIQEEPVKAGRKDYILVMRKPQVDNGQISGTVLRASDGQPISAFKVRLDFSNMGSSSGLSSGLVEHGMSFDTRDGRFTLTGLREGDSYRVVVEAPGFLLGSADPVEVLPADKVDFRKAVFRLHPSSPFEGTVTEEGTGSPLGGVLVSAYDTYRVGSSPWMWDYMAERNSVTVRTDADGRFRFESMPITSGLVTLEKPGYGRTVLRDISFSRPLKASLHKGAVIAGQAVDDAGNPAPGVPVQVDGLESMISFGRIRADADGRFRAPDLPPGSYFITQYDAQYKNPRSHEAEISAGQEYVIDWKDRGDVIIEGRVLLAGAPLSGVRVSLSSSSGTGYNHRGSAVTDSGGVYSLAVRKPGDYMISYSLGEWRDPGFVHFAQMAALKNGTNRIDKDIPAASVSGTVVDARTRKPAPGASISAYRKATAVERAGVDSYHWLLADPCWWQQRSAKADDSGRFELKNLEEGEWLLAIDPSGGPNQGVFGQPFRLEKNAARKGMAITVPATGSAEITLVGASEAAPPSARFIVCRSSLGVDIRPNQSDWPENWRTGMVPLTQKFTNLQPGRYRAFAGFPYFFHEPVEFEVKAGQTTRASIKLQDRPRIVFQLKETADNMVPGAPQLCFRISTADGWKPVIENYQGMTWGSVMPLLGDAPRSAYLAIRPGVYSLKAVLRQGNIHRVDDTEHDLGSWEGTVEVTQGKDAIVSIPYDR